jgi:hypothetical protein
MGLCHPQARAQRKTSGRKVVPTVEPTLLSSTLVAPIAPRPLSKNLDAKSGKDSYQGEGRHGGRWEACAAPMADT